VPDSEGESELGDFKFLYRTQVREGFFNKPLSLFFWDLPSVISLHTS